MSWTVQSCQMAVNLCLPFTEFQHLTITKAPLKGTILILTMRKSCFWGLGESFYVLNRCLREAEKGSLAPLVYSWAAAPALLSGGKASDE